MQDGEISRPEAVRRLVELGLKEEMTDDRDIERKRAKNAARVAADELPPPISIKRTKILRWNGEAPLEPVLSEIT
jgi:hypothetical protein